jgi:hypothetical protein
MPVTLSTPAFPPSLEYFAVNVLPMEVARKPPRAKSPKPPAPASVPKVSAKTARRITWQRRSAALLGTVASAMTGVSLTHIAGGVQLMP